MSLTRRTTLALAGAALCSGGARAQPALAPSASDGAAWITYETRLRARLADAGGGVFDRQAAREAWAQTNRIRVALGVGALTWNEALATSARAHVADLSARGYIEHLSPEGFDPSHRFWLLDRTTIGSPAENIAYHRGADAPRTPAQMLEQWRHSPGHWANLNRATHAEAGFALLRRPDRAWLVGLFARPLAVLSEPLPFQASERDVARAIQTLPAGLRPRLAPPQGSKQGRVGDVPAMMQITAIRPVAGGGPGAYDLIGGPIFQVAQAGHWRPG